MDQRRPLRLVLSLTLWLLCQGLAQAAWVSTPGAIGQIDGPAGMQFQYDPATDRSIFTKPGQTRIMVSVLPPFEARAVMVEVLKAYGASQYIGSVKQDLIGGREAASVSARLQTSNWWIVVKDDDLNLFIQVEDAGDALQQRETVETLLRSIRLTPPVYPPLVAGSYNTGSHYTGDVQSTIGVYSESGVTLTPAGGIVSSGLTTITGADVSGYSASEGQAGWWQVRGDRILSFYPPNHFYNYRFQAFTNGLEIYPPQGKKLLWVRQ